MKNNGMKTTERAYNLTMNYIEAYARAKRTAALLNNGIHDLESLDKAMASIERYPAQPGIGWYHDSKKETPVVEVIKLLKSEQMDQTKLAKLTGFSNSQVTKWKNGETTPNKYAWWMLSMYLGVKLRDLPAFLHMVGAIPDDLCKQDTILKSVQDHQNRFEELPRLLKKYNCMQGSLMTSLKAMLKYLKDHQQSTLDDAA